MLIQLQACLFLHFMYIFLCRCNWCITCLCHIMVTDIGIVSRDILCTVSWGKKNRKMWQALWWIALFRLKLLHFWGPKSGFLPDKHRQELPGAYRARVPWTHYVIALILPKVHMQYSMGYDRPLTIWMIAYGAVHRSQWCRQHPIFSWWRETYSVDTVCLNMYIGSPYRIYALQFFSLVSGSAPIFR